MRGDKPKTQEFYVPGTVFPFLPPPHTHLGNILTPEPSCSTFIPVAMKDILTKSNRED